MLNMFDNKNKFQNQKTKSIDNLQTVDVEAANVNGNLNNKKITKSTCSSFRENVFPICCALFGFLFFFVFFVVYWYQIIYVLVNTVLP